MSDREHGQQMLLMAENDLKAIGGMTDVETFSSEIFGFHAQQAVEKALKSWLSMAEVRYPKIHDLEELFELLVDNGQEVPNHFRELTSLTDFAVQFRYQLAEDLGEPLRRNEVISKVAEFVNYVAMLIKEST